MSSGGSKKSPTKQIESMKSSAVTLLFQPDAAGALALWLILVQATTVY